MVHILNALRCQPGTHFIVSDRQVQTFLVKSSWNVTRNAFFGTSSHLFSEQPRFHDKVKLMRLDVTVGRVWEPIETHSFAFWWAVKRTADRTCSLYIFLRILKWKMQVNERIRTDPLFTLWYLCCPHPSMHLCITQPFHAAGLSCNTRPAWADDTVIFSPRSQVSSIQTAVITVRW